MIYSGKTLRVKQGETFRFSGAVLNKATGEPLDTSLLTLKSEIRRATPERELVAALSCVWLAPGVVSISSAGSTVNWPWGNALWDIQVIDSEGQVQVTESVEVVIERHVTNPGA